MKLIVPLLSIFFLFQMTGITQEICSGNLGENIFERGDFGSGINPILTTDPGIAPGYNYTTVVPPDGSYTICSNTGALSGLYPTWIRVGDNSNDPNGYMMVVNASFDPGIFYEEVVEGLCENTLYEFSADIINLIFTGVTDHIDPNVSFLIDDVEVYTTGTIPKTERWEQYGFTFVTSATQSSVKLTLRNNAPGGIGNDLGLDNISFRPCGPSSFINIEKDTTIFLCIDDDPLSITADIDGGSSQQFAIQWQSSTDGFNWDILEDSTNNVITHTNFNPGDYYYRYFSAGNEINIQNEKCRIISDIIKITILPDTYEVRDTICEGNVYTFGNQSLTESGAYTENFSSFFGCDSTVFLDLVFVPPLEFDFTDLTITDPSCFGFSDGGIQVNGISGGYGNVSFEIFDDIGPVSGLGLSSGEYSIIASDRFLCSDELIVNLTEPPEISVELGLDTVVRLGDDIVFEPEYSEQFPTINWGGSGVFDCLDCERPNFVPYNSGDVVVTVTTESGCSTSDSVFITVKEDEVLHLPNVFSPNGDRINDEFTIHYYGRSVAGVTRFAVHDRWGALIHQIEDVVIGNGGVLWDGFENDREIATGVYVFYLELELINGRKLTQFGDITVIK